MDKQTFLEKIQTYKYILTEENFKNIIENVDKFNEQEKEKIINDLTTAHKMLEVNKNFLEQKNSLLKEAIVTVDKFKNKFQKGKKEFFQNIENEENAKSAKTAESLINNL